MPKAQTREEDDELDETMNVEDLRDTDAGDADADDNGGDEGDTEEQKRLAAIELKARSQGWFPEAEWDEERAKRTNRKKPAHFLSPEDYLKQVDTNTPLLRSQLRRMETTIDDLKKKNEDMHGIFEYQQKRAKEAIAKARKEGREEAEREIDEAIDEGDKAKGKAARAKLADIEKEEREELIAERPAKKEDPAEEPGDDDEPKRKPLHPTLQGWIDENAWFNKDMALQAVMIQFNNELQAKSPGMDMRARLDQAKRMTKNKFPEKFGINPRRTANGGGLEPGNDKGAGRGERTFEALPREDREMYARHKAQFEAKGGTYTKEEFLKAYFEGQ